MYSGKSITYFDPKIRRYPVFLIIWHERIAKIHISLCSPIVCAESEFFSPHEETLDPCLSAIECPTETNQTAWIYILI